MNTLEYVLAALAAIEKLAAAGQAVQGVIDETKTTLEKAKAEGRDPTPEERAALDAKIAADLAQLDNTQA